MHLRLNTYRLSKKLPLFDLRTAVMLAALSLLGVAGSADAQYVDQQQAQYLAQQLQQGGTSAGMNVGIGTGAFGGGGAGLGAGMNTGASGPIILGGSTGADWPPAVINVPNPPPKPYVPGEFERFVNKLAREAKVREGQDGMQPQGPDGAASAASSNDQQNQGGASQATQGQWAIQGAPRIQRFGADLISSQAGFSQDFSPQVPPDYLISPGDELVVSVWGSVDANLRLIVDRGGRVNIPRVGPVMVSGVRYGDLPAVLHRQVSEVFRNFQLSVSLGRLRSIRIYVTGFAMQPGSYTVSSLSTIVNALMQTGGPSSSGSFRDIELRRRGKLIATFDLYDLLLRGDTSGDRVLQAEDVLQIGPIGPQVALIGSVNRPGIFELKQGETVADVIRMAAGFDPVADNTRLALEQLADRSSLLVKQVRLPSDSGATPQNGDVFRAFSLVNLKQPGHRQNKHVVVEGEVQHPGDYILPPTSTINDAISAAGGLMPGAYIYGVEFDRESVRLTQQENYDRALRDMETNFARLTAEQSATSAEDLTAQKASTTNADRLLSQLRAVKPTGRVVLQMAPNEAKLPDLSLEDGDRLYVPAVPTTVGVFGSVFNGGSYLFNGDRTVGDYLHLSGGTTRDADNDAIFVVRANGTVVSNRQDSGWFGLSSAFNGLRAQPGDTIFVPSKFDQRTFVQGAKDWTQILYQLGLGLAGLKTLR